MAITLVRHTTPDVAKGTCYGRTDLALADSFVREAQAVLAAVPPAARVITSPLMRCRHLAAQIAAQQGTALEVQETWIEMDFGAWEGIPWSDISRAALDDWATDFMGYAGHGGESVAMLEARVRAALETVQPDSVVVTHSGCIRAACAILGCKERWDTETPFGGMVVLP